MKLPFLPSLLVALSVGSLAASERTEAIRDSIALLRTAGGDADQSQLAAAFRDITRLPASELPAILGDMKGSGVIGENWFRAAVDTVAERELARGGELPRAELEQFLLDRNHAPRARRIAFEWLARVDPTARDRLIPGMLDDPSLELRRDAVDAEIRRAESLEGDQAVATYCTALDAARDLDQVKLCVAALEKLEKPVKMAAHFGFLTDWHLVGPFDNKDRGGFETVYPPEDTIDLAAEYAGLEGQVGWIEHQTEHPEGEVDLIKVYGELKEVLAYAVGEFHAAEPRDVQIRLNCVTACRVWVNGERVIDREVYHTGYQFDQYVADVHLKAGRNTILVKVCQNEQTETWTNVWKFALRVCDKLGGKLKDGS